jgi:hypothetical protein
MIVNHHYPSHMKGVRGLLGVTGPLGYPGPVGVVGIVGVAGPTGPRGRRGHTGTAGVGGPGGVRGTVGHVGQDGPQGVPGTRGEGGAKGNIGPKGAFGQRGVTGAAGPAGEMGEVGNEGAKGKAGAIGKRGPEGVQGTIGPMGPSGKRGRLGRRGVDGEPGAPGPAGPSGKGGVRGYRGAPGLFGASGMEGVPGAPGTPGTPGPRGMTGDRGLGGADSPGSAFSRFMSGEWLDKNAVFKTEARARVFENGMIKFSRGRRKHEKLFGVPLVGPGQLRKDRHYTVKLRIAAVDLTEGNSLFVGISDSKYIGGFLRTESGDTALGRVLVGDVKEDDIRYEVVHDSRDQWALHSEGETGWYESRKALLKNPISLADAVAKGLIVDRHEAEAKAAKAAAKAAGGAAAAPAVAHPESAGTAQELATAAAAALQTDAAILGTSSTSTNAGARKLLSDAADPDASVTATTEARTEGSNYEDKLRAAVRHPEAFGAPDEAKVRGGEALSASAVGDSVPAEWTDKTEEDERREATALGEPSWKLPHTGWLTRGKLHTYSPRWFEVYIRIDTSERTSVLARTNSQYVPVLADLPFKMEPAKGLSLAVFAADPAEEYGIFAIDAYIIEETP